MDHRGQVPEDGVKGRAANEETGNEGHGQGLRCRRLVLRKDIPKAIGQLTGKVTTRDQIDDRRQKEHREQPHIQPPTRGLRISIFK